MANGMNYGPYAGSPMTGIHSPEFFRGMQQRGMEAANAPNWLTDPEAPWNVWAQGLEGYLQDWVKSQQQGLLADLSMRTQESAQQAIGQGLYTGTYTTSLPAENLAKMVAQHQRGYAGAMSELQSAGLSQLMKGKQLYGTQMLGATLENLMRQMQAKAASYGWGDFLGDFMSMVGEIVPG